MNWRLLELLNLIKNDEFLRELVKDGYEVVRIGREHFKKEDALFNSLESCEVIINLCGAPIIKKWDEVYKHELYVSRIETTKRFIKEIKKASNLPVIASGGVKDINDIKLLIKNKIYGTIIGKAFYEGTINLKEVFKTIKEKK